jgi:hypothetical protein
MFGQQEFKFPYLFEEDPAGDEKFHLLHCDKIGHVVRYSVAANGGFTAADTNNFDVDLLDGGAAGAGTDVIAGYNGAATGGTGTLADTDPREPSITDTKEDADDELILHYDENGSGPGTSPASICVGVGFLEGDPAGVLT